MNRWTLGFVFNSHRNAVLLIHKLRPDHQRGKWNGLGGKYEENETGPECIAREVREESGLQIAPHAWRTLGRVYGDDWEMDVFTSLYPGDPSDAKTTTDEEIAWFPIDAIPKSKHNLSWLIPLCLDALQHDEIERIDIRYTAKDRWK